MTELEAAQAQIKQLQMRLLQETVRALSMEKQAAETSMAFLQLRLPMIDQQLSLAQHKLSELAKEEHGAA